VSDQPRILCVDDEPQILQGLTLHLRRQFRTETADSGAAALAAMQQRGPPAVIVSDMSMPQMDGAALLKQVMRLYPETTRILLTGDNTRGTAVSAVNDGQVFRFLTKPCPPEELRSAVEAGVTHHHLVTAEKVLMQETLIGCINALTDVLAMTHPVAFGRSNRIKRLTQALAAAAGCAASWQLEAAAMLSQIGYISLPAELVDKLCEGRPMSAADRALAAAAPQVAAKLLQRIPRIDKVLHILAASQPGAQAPGEDADRLNAEILRLVLAYDGLLVSGQPPATALASLRALAAPRDAALLDTLTAVVGAQAGTQYTLEVSIGAAVTGMIMLEDLRTAVGTLLVPKGFEITDAFLERTRNFDSAMLHKKVRVLTAVATQRQDSAT
jgi:response regulator RpfG family c-di-GMP phosphodiesterase